MLNILSKLPELAKTNRWQTLFSLSKDRQGFRLFQNDTEFNQLQLLFLNYLSFYNSALIDIEMGNLPEWAFKKDIYLDAYSHYSRTKRKKEGAQSRQPSQLSNGKSPNKLQGMKIVYGGK
jgi:hypothetical protein